MTTNNAVDNGLTGATGSGNFAGSTSPTFVTPVLGAATATSVAFSPTTGGIVGTATNDNASAGKVGEFVSSQVVFASRVNVTAQNTPQDVTSISLTAGDWDIHGGINFLANASTSTSYISWCSATSATLPDLSLVSQTSVTGIGNCSLTTQVLRVSLASPGTAYLTAYATFSAGNPQVSGFISARRVR